MDQDDVDATPKWHGPLPSRLVRRGYVAQLELPRIVDGVVEISGRPDSLDFQVRIVDESAKRYFTTEHGWRMDADGVLTHSTLGGPCLDPIIDVERSWGDLCSQGAVGWMPYYTDDVLDAAVRLAFDRKPLRIESNDDTANWRSDEQPLTPKYRTMKVSVNQRAGLSRPLLCESTFARHTKTHAFLAVFDGHGSATLPQQCALSAYGYFARHASASIETRLRYCFDRMQVDYGFRSSSCASGCVAVFDFVRMRLHVAWVGSCFAFAIDRHGVSRVLSEPHKGENAAEVARLMLAGSYVSDPMSGSRVAGRKMLTRCIGDMDFRRMFPAESRSLVCTPDYRVYDILDTDALYAIASDGYVPMQSVFVDHKHATDAYSLDELLTAEGIVNERDDQSLGVLTLQ